MDGDSLLGKLFLKDKLSDVRVIVENGTEKANFPAHSLVLKLQSPVIKTMLESDFVEGQTQTIVITDFKVRHISLFLKFLYTDVLPESYTDVCKLVKIAYKYLVSKLTERCVESLIKFVNLQNVYELCGLADKYSLEELLEKCMFLIKMAAFKLLKSDDLKCLSKKLMEKIVRADDLNIMKEIDAFWAIWKWGKLNLCNRGIPFSKADVKEFTKDLLKHVQWNLIIDHEDKEELRSLGIGVCTGVEVLQTEIETSETRLFEMPVSWFNQCDALRLNESASSSKLLKQNFKPSRDEVHLMRAVSLNESPLFVVGVLFASTKDGSSLKKAELKCSCDGAVSVVEIYPFKPDVDYMAITDSDGATVTNYHEMKYALPKPIEVRNNEKFNFSMVNHKLQFGSLELEFGDGGKTIYSKKGKAFFIHGKVYGIKKFFFL